MTVLAITDASLWAMAAGFISLATLVGSMIMNSRTLTRAADAQRVSNLESDLRDARGEVAHLDERVAECERDRTELRRKVDDLLNRELILLRRLARLEDST